MSFLLIASFPDSILKFRGALLDALLAKGLSVHVAAPGLNGDSSVRQYLESKGICVHDIPLSRTGLNPLSDFSTFFYLWRLIRRVKPKYLMGYTVKPVIYGSLASMFAGNTERFALITGLGYAFQELRGASFRHKVVRFLVQRLYSFALTGAKMVFFQNPDDQKLFLSLGILKPSTSSVVVNGSGVDVSEYQVKSIPSNIRFLMISRFLGDKGVREYALAAHKIRTVYPNVTFALAGWIDDNPDAIDPKELNDWITEGTLEYLGRLDDVRPAIAASSVYVLPSYREGTPRTVLEAMAMGRPIITTDAPGCRETVIPGENGFLVAVKNVNEIVDAMIKFIESPKLVITMGEKSRTLAENKYDVIKVNFFMLNKMGL